MMVSWGSGVRCDCLHSPYCSCGSSTSTFYNAAFDHTGHTEGGVSENHQSFHYYNVTPVSGIQFGTDSLIIVRHKSACLAGPAVHKWNSRCIASAIGTVGIVWHDGLSWMEAKGQQRARVTHTVHFVKVLMGNVWCHWWNVYFLLTLIWSPLLGADLEDPVSSLTSLGPEVHCLVLTCVLHSMAVMNNSQLLCFMRLCSKALHRAGEFGGHLGGFCCQHDLKLEYISYISIYGFTRPPRVGKK